MRMYPYLAGGLNIRAVLDEQSHGVHVTVLTRHNQRCNTVLRSQPASTLGSGAAEAMCVSMHVCQRIMIEIKLDHVRVFMCSTRLVLDW